MPERKLNIHSVYIKVSIHIFTWLCIVFLPVAFMRSPSIETGFIAEHTLGVSFLAGYYYLNTRFLIPRFLGRKKILLFVAFIAALVVINIYTQIGIEKIFNPEMFQKHWFLRVKIRGAVFSCLLVLAVGSLLKITEEWFKNERQKKDMENEKLQSELAFLKSQINPHFLFNTLNNIYSLSMIKSPDAPAAILRLSGLMRYMLYESNTDKVEIDKEISYLRNYIDLQRMRISGEVKIDFSVEGDTEGVKIEPMLLIPFVENAFKHGISYKIPSEITIFISLKNKNELCLKVANTLNHVSPEAKDKNSGIGLPNVVKRLNLLYPSRHKLSIKEENDRYFSELSIWLHHD